MEINTIYEEDTTLNLDTASIKDRTGFTSSSLTDINQIPVFSDAFEENFENKKAKDEDRDEMLINQVFFDDATGVFKEDICSQLFLQTDSEIIIRNDNIGGSAQSFMEIAAGLCMAGIFVAVIVLFYGRKGKGKRNVNDQYAGHKQK